MIINNVELPDIDIADADTAEVYEKALDLVREAVQYDKSAAHSQIIRQCCNGVFSAFDLIFGDGTSKKLFGERTNFVECLKAFDEFTGQVNEISRKNNEIIKEIMKKYNTADNNNSIPNSNRKNKNNRRNHKNHR